MTSQRQNRIDLQNASVLLEKLDKIATGMYNGVDHTLSKNLLSELRKANLEANETLEKLTEVVKNQKLEGIPIGQNSFVDVVEINNHQKKDIEESKLLHRQCQSNALLMAKAMGAKSK